MSGKSKNAPRHLPDLFPSEFDAPCGNLLKDGEIEEKLDCIYNFLADRSILLEFRPGIPGRDVYNYLLDDLFKDKYLVIEMGQGLNIHITGCNGCFKKDYYEEPE
ncbi:MAG: hypothetical protein ABIA63_07150 [bacterium]